MGGSASSHGSVHVPAPRQQKGESHLGPGQEHKLWPPGWCHCSPGRKHRGCKSQRHTPPKIQQLSQIMIFCGKMTFQAKSVARRWFPMSPIHQLALVSLGDRNKGPQRGMGACTMTLIISPLWGGKSQVAARGGSLLPRYSLRSRLLAVSSQSLSSGASWCPCD